MKVKIRPTRFQGLGYALWVEWRVWDISTERPAPIGPHYKTKMELLADIDRLAQERGFSEAR